MCAGSMASEDTTLGEPPHVVKSPDGPSDAREGRRRGCARPVLQPRVEGRPGDVRDAGRGGDAWARHDGGRDSAPVVAAGALAAQPGVPAEGIAQAIEQIERDRSAMSLVAAN